MASTISVGRLASLDPVLTQATDAPSPMQEKIIAATEDSGIQQRIASAPGAGPTVRQRTQSEIIDLELENWRRRNPYSVRYIPFDQLREMTTDMMLAFGWHFTVAPLIRADWYVESPDAQLAAALDAAFRPVATTTYLNKSNVLWYGHQPMVKRFYLGRLGGFYRDPQATDPSKDLPIWDSSADMLLWKAPMTVNPSHCIPMWDEDGDMMGFKFSTLPIPHYDLISAASAYGYEVIAGKEIGPDYAMWCTNEAELNFGSCFGSPRTKRAYRFWWSYWFRWALADRAFENTVDPAKIVYFPTDFDEFIDSDGEPTHIKQMRETAIRTGDSARSGSTVALPGDFAEGPDGKATNTRKWAIQYLEGQQHFADLEATFALLDTLKLRSWMIPEQSLIEGRGCLAPDTPVLAPRDHDLYPDGVPLVDLRPGQLVWSFNEQSARFELWPVKRVFKTMDSTPLYRLTLDDGSEIIGTPDHPFMSRDGVWREMIELKPGDRLMPLYESGRDSAFSGDRLGMSDYEPMIMRDPDHGSFEVEYRVISEHMGWAGHGRALNVHHDDYRHANTSLENLKPLTPTEHRAAHVADPVWRERHAEATRAGMAALPEETKAKMRREHWDEQRREAHSERMKIVGLESITKFRDSLTPGEYKKFCSKRSKKTWEARRANGNMMTFKDRVCERCGDTYTPVSGRQKYCVDCVTPARQPFMGQIKRPTVYAAKNCQNCDQEFLPRSGSQKRCPDCMASVINHRVVSVEKLDQFGEVWDVEIDGPEYVSNFVARGVVVHNSSSSRNVAAQLGEVVQESQQLLVDQWDGEVSDHMFAQFIAANYPEKIGTPARKVSQGLGVIDEQLFQTVLTLVGQVRGNVLPVDMVTMLKKANIPILNENQMRQEFTNIAKLAAIAGPPVTAPSPIGTQGYNAGVEKTPMGETRYFQAPERITLAESDGFMNELPDTPHYRDAGVRSAIVRLRRLFVDRYSEQYDSFAKFLEGQQLHLAEPQQATSQGLSKQDAQRIAGLIVASWAASKAPGIAGSPLEAIAVPESAAAKTAGLIGKIALSGGAGALKGARLDADDFGAGVLSPWISQRVGTALSSVDDTVKDEAQNWLENELQSSTDSHAVAAAAREHFSGFPATHSDRVALTEGSEALNRGTLEALRLAGVEQVQAHDASDGTDLKTDTPCLQRDGKIMPIQQALGETLQHPRCTLHFSAVQTSKFSTERVKEIPAEVAAEGAQVGYDAHKEILYLLEDVDPERERLYLNMLGDQLAYR